MPELKHPFRSIVLKTLVTHTLTYSLAGMLALTLFNYAELFADPNNEYPMRLVSNPLVIAGPLFQPIRGLLFGIVFYLLRDILFRRGMVGSSSGPFYSLWESSIHLPRRQARLRV